MPKTKSSTKKPAREKRRVTRPSKFRSASPQTHVNPQQSQEDLKEMLAAAQKFYLEEGYQSAWVSNIFIYKSGINSPKKESRRIT